MKTTKWNEKLKKLAGRIISCNKFEKDGLETEGFVVNKDGSLSFYNELRSLNAATSLVEGEFKKYWSAKQKGAFLKAAQL